MGLEYMMSSKPVGKYGSSILLFCCDCAMLPIYSWNVYTVNYITDKISDITYLQ